eukprot:COSAG02_NODE_8809_length_2437_cov_2.034217_2_plen_53_part_00
MQQRGVRPPPVGAAEQQRLGMSRASHLVLLFFVPSLAMYLDATVVPAQSSMT